MPHSFLILGANGQLAREFARLFSRRSLSFTAPDERDSSITDTDTIARLIDASHASVVINCAAYNAVDAAEQDRDTAFRINAEAVAGLALLCAEKKIRFVHFSSDYVFDGTKGGLYTEEDAVHPLGAYGASKRKGEEAVLAAGGTGLVLRTSWVFGNGMQNFLFKMRQWSQKNSVLRLTADEVSVPTSTIDLAEYTLRAVDAGLSGLYHLTNSDYASRYEWGRYAAKKMGLSSTIIPVPMSMFPSPAARPLFSAMSSARIQSALGAEIPDWRDAVDRFLAAYPAE